MSIERKPFGKTAQGKDVEQFTLSSTASKVAVKIITYGGHVAEIDAPDRDGKVGNVILGFETLEEFTKQTAYIGALIGRVGNRIARGTFTLDGQQYHIPINNRPNALHGGRIGFHTVVWNAEPKDDPIAPSLKLTHISPDGEDGFPGTLHTTVVYTLDKDALKIEYSATTDLATPVNLTNHAYFNLKGPGSGDVLGHTMMIAAAKYTPVDNTLIPTGELLPVKDTPFDFTQPKTIGERIAQIPIGGYDHNYVLDSTKDLSKIAARVVEPSTGRVLEVFTTEPGLQFYAGIGLNGSIKGIGGAYQRYGAFCLETQHFPDAVNHPSFPSTILRPGETYRSTTIYRFTTDRK